MSDALVVLLIGDEHGGQIVAAHIHVSDVLLLFDRGSGANGRALGDDLGREFHELLNTAALKEAKACQLGGRLEDSRLAAIGRLVEHVNGEKFHDLCSSSLLLLLKLCLKVALN